MKLRESDIELEEFYKTQTWETQFLLTDAGKPYASLFKTVKIKYLLDSFEQIQVIKNDNILSRDWIQSAYEEVWLHCLKIIKNEDLGLVYNGVQMVQTIIILNSLSQLI